MFQRYSIGGCAKFFISLTLLIFFILKQQCSRWKIWYLKEGKFTRWLIFFRFSFTVSIVAIRHTIVKTTEKIRNKKYYFTRRNWISTAKKTSSGKLIWNEKLHLDTESGYNTWFSFSFSQQTFLLSFFNRLKLQNFIKTSSRIYFLSPFRLFPFHFGELNRLNDCWCVHSSGNGRIQETKNGRRTSLTTNLDEP